MGKNTEKSRDNDNNQKLKQNCSYCGEFPHKTTLQGTAYSINSLNLYTKKVKLVKTNVIILIDTGSWMNILNIGQFKETLYIVQNNYLGEKQM